MAVMMVTIASTRLNIMIRRRIEAESGVGRYRKDYVKSRSLLTGATVKRLAGRTVSTFMIVAILATFRASIVSVYL